MRENFLKRLFKHKVLVSFAFSETSAVRGFHVHSVSFITVVSLIFGGAFALYAEYQKRIDIEMARRGEIPNYLKERINELESEKEMQQEQIRLFAEELGVLQARIDRFDAIGERLLNDPALGAGLADPDLGGKGGVTLPKLNETPKIEDLQEQIVLMQDKADAVDSYVNASMKLIATQEIEKSQKPYMWPVLHKRSYVSSSFGYRSDPFSKKKRRFHGGTDFVAPRGSPIISTGDGVVVFSGYRYNYGISVEIRHAHGFVSRYAHMDASLVKNGQTVRAGEQIGKLGSTGRSTGPHLHLELLIDDTKVDPYPFVSNSKAEMIERVNQLAQHKK